MSLLDKNELIAEFVDSDWYKTRYPDVARNDLDPLQHFVRYGAAERRDPNPFFDSAWYIEHYPDVAASGLIPLLHYIQAGAAELRHPHPKFDAVYYADKYPHAAHNPLLYHLRAGKARGYQTEAAIDIRDFLPSENDILAHPSRVFADVVVLVLSSSEQAKQCIRSILADRALPLARVIVIDDHFANSKLSAWLTDLAAEGQIHLIRNPNRQGFAASATIGMRAAESHDVVLLNSECEVLDGWLPRLVAHAYSGEGIATISPLPDIYEHESFAHAAQICQTINRARFVDAPGGMNNCIYIRRAFLNAIGAEDFWSQAPVAGWRHRIACDTLLRSTIPLDPAPSDGIPFQFALTAALYRESKQPVILMVTHNFGGGVRRHIDGLVQRYRHAARFLLLQATDRGAALSVPQQSSRPVLTLPADRLDDLAAVLRSANVSRIHIHHMLQMDMDIRALVHRLGVPFDVTVHDYFAICPQVNLLRWEEGLYCNEPPPAVCNACIASQSSHGARDIVSWRRDWAWQFLSADRVICPSEDVRRRLVRHGFGERTVVIPHEQQKETTWITRLPKFLAPPLRIVVLGVLANHKGARAVAELAELAGMGTIEVHLIGHLEASFPESAKKWIKETGPYQDIDLPSLLKRIQPHVFWFPSSAPETYSYTLSTAIATGMPIVATNIGSFPERLAGRPLTWLVDHHASSTDWQVVFNEVEATLRKRIVPPPARRPTVEPDFYDNCYLQPTPRASNGFISRKPRIAVVPERYSSGGLTPCAYVRLLQPLDHPAIGAAFDIILADIETIFDYDADILVTQRHVVPDVETVDRLAEHARSTGAKLLFDLDDDLLDVPLHHPDAPTLRPFAKSVRRIVTIADAVWVSTVGLAERLATIRPDAIVIENRLDERLWIEQYNRNNLFDDPIRILCMGTATHDSDFAMIEPALVRLKNEYGLRIVVDVLGMTSRSQLPAEVNRIGPSTHASRSYPGFVNWLRSVRPRWHIGLAPLLDTSFNRAKSPIKAMDYAALGMTVLASDMPVYRGSIADGPAGHLVANDHRAWHAALDALIRDHHFRVSCAIQARQAFAAQATLASHAEFRRDAWMRLLPDRIPNDSDALPDLPSGPTIPNGTTDSTTGKSRNRAGRR